MTLANLSVSICSWWQRRRGNGSCNPIRVPGRQPKLYAFHLFTSQWALKRNRYLSGAPLALSTILFQQHFLHKDKKVIYFTSIGHIESIVNLFSSIYLVFRNDILKKNQTANWLCFAARDWGTTDHLKALYFLITVSQMRKCKHSSAGTRGEKSSYLLYAKSFTKPPWTSEPLQFSFRSSAAAHRMSFNGWISPIVWRQ